MRWLHHVLLHIKLYRNFITWTKAKVLPGFGTLSIYEVIASLIYEFSQDSLASKASSLAYSFMLALFPGIIFLFTLIPYVPVDKFQESLLRLLSSILPYNAFAALQTTIEDIIKNQNLSLLSVGFVTALYF